MNEPPVQSAVTNPFSHLRDESHGLYFASTHSWSVEPAKWHGPNRFQFWVLDSSGEQPMRLRVGGQEILRPPHSLVLYAPNIPYEEFIEQKPLLRMSWLLFRVSDRQSPLHKLVKANGYCIFNDTGSMVRTLINQIVFHFLNPRPGADWFIRSDFYRILALLQTAEDEPQRQIVSPDVQASYIEKTLHTHVENYLYKYSNRNVTLSEMAEALHVSLSSFSHRYNEESGETFTQTKTRVRINRAKVMLLAGNVPVKNVAFDLGFSNASHFSRVFHRWVGMSPVSFRKEFSQSSK